MEDLKVEESLTDREKNLISLAVKAATKEMKSKLKEVHETERQLLEKLDDQQEMISNLVNQLDDVKIQLMKSNKKAGFMSAPLAKNPSEEITRSAFTAGLI